MALSISNEMSKLIIIFSIVTICVIFPFSSGIKKQHIPLYENVEKILHSQLKKFNSFSRNEKGIAKDYYLNNL